MSPKTTDHGVPSKVETTADTAEIPSSPKSVTTNGKEAVDDEHMGGATLSLLMGTCKSSTIQLFITMLVIPSTSREFPHSICLRVSFHPVLR